MKEKKHTVADIPDRVLREVIFFGIYWIVNLIAEMVNRKTCRHAEKKTLKDNMNILHNVLNSITRKMKTDDKAKLEETIENSCDFYFNSFSLLGLVKPEHQKETLDLILTSVTAQYENK
jgi:hypothetical protein